ncbi:MAG TPA: amidase [Gemmatimonadales bacterium]
MTDSPIDRRDFLLAGAAAGALAVGLRPLAARAQAAGTTEFDLEEVSVIDLQHRMATGQDTARSIAEKYLARIEAIDRTGPRVNCVIETNPDAVAIADQLDAERRGGKVRGPLHGVPVLIKDNIATADRMETTAGSLALVGGRPATDAFLVRRLRDAGAVILGKTNLSEWANFRSTHSVSGWSGRGGLCRNPYALDRNTSGSSSGTGGSISANLGAIGIGTETDGSIVSPANSCGLVGLKPTVGLVSRTGIVPISHTQDTAGPMTRTVTDAAVLLSAIGGYDSEDRGMVGQLSRQAPADYTAFLRRESLRGVRIGVVRERLMGYSPHADAVADEAIAALKGLGAEVVDPANFAKSTHDVGTPEYEVLLYEYRAGLAAYFSWVGANAPVRTIEDVIAFNEQHRDRELPYFGQEIMHMSAAKGPLTDPKYRQALATCRRLSRVEGIDALMKQHRLDALFAPTGAPAWVTDLVNGDSVGGGSSTMAAVSGYPHITVPAGMVRGLPVGVSFFGRAWSEGQLLRIAFNFEQETKARRAPRFRATADI